MSSDEQQLREELQQLREDYKTLEHNFDIMSEGYQESLLLYDKLEETYHELEETNKELDKARRRAEEASQMKTNFIQQISHEIRTPLNILSGFTQIITMPGMELDEATREEVTRGISDNTNRITSLVNKMLELADANSQAEIAAQAADESGITQAAHLDFDLQMGDGSEVAMLTTNLQHSVRALSLLLDNARKFTQPAEAAVGAGASSKRGRALLRLEIDAATSMFHFIIEDNGIGVPAEEAEHIFDEFVQLDQYYDGTGIGLTVARGIARRLGGDITIDTTYHDENGGGARFILALPM